MFACEIDFYIAFYAYVIWYRLNKTEEKKNREKNENLKDNFWEN